MTFARADFAKDRNEAVHPLPEDFVLHLVEACSGLPPEASLLNFEPVHAARLLDDDLTTADIKKSNFHGKVDFHALRVTHIQMGIELGFDVKTAQTLARHKTPDMTMNTYAKVNPDRIRKAVDNLGRAVSEAETAQKSQNAVKTEELRMAVGAEGLTYPPAEPEDANLEIWCGREELNLQGLAATRS